MSILKDFERHVLDLLAPSALSVEQIEKVGREGRLVKYEYSGCGYFVTVAHEILPQERRVCSEPALMGHANGIDCGFLLFIENGELMLECHTWGEIDVPEDFRDQDVRVEVLPA